MPRDQPHCKPIGSAAAPSRPGGEFTATFGKVPAAGASCPGRINLIGEHTDYNGGLVLPAAISLETRVWVRYREDTEVRGVSAQRGPSRARLSDPPCGDWLDYVRGVAQALRGARRIPAWGFEVWVQSDLPEGSGLSSSAALEVATALALAAAAGTPFRASEQPELARLCQQAEVEFVGVPCGIMDQYAVACARADAAILLDCALQQAEWISLPRDTAILVFDTGVRRELRDGGYERRRRECESALESAREILGRSVPSASAIRTEDLPALERALEPLALRRLRHVVSENSRVRSFAEAVSCTDLERAGDLLHASHESLAVDYEVSWPEADHLVAASRRLPGLFGARMMGAGWGGCTLHLARTGRADESARALAESFERRFHRPPRFWRLHAVSGARLLR